MDNEKIIDHFGFRVNLENYVGIGIINAMLNEARKDEKTKQIEVFKKMVDDSADHYDEVILARSNKCEHKEGQHVHLAVKNFMDDLHLVRWQERQKTAKEIFEWFESNDTGYGDIAVSFKNKGREEYEQFKARFLPELKQGFQARPDIK